MYDIVVQASYMTPAEHIIDGIFGGSRQMARDLSDPERGKVYAPTTVQSWKDAGGIPVKHQAWVLERGRELGKPISPEDFFRAPPAAEGQRAAS